jgi:hypothetical protein
MSLPENQVTTYKGKQLRWLIGDKHPDGFWSAWAGEVGTVNRYAYFAKFWKETRELTCIIKIK